MKITTLMAALLLILSISAQAQNDQNKLKQTIRLTGVVMDADERSPLPYVSVRIASTSYGTATDSIGYFSIFMNPGDTLRFTSIGYTDARFVMPFDLTDDNYSLVQLMRKKTIMLNEVVVFPWPTLDNFTRAFLDAEPKKDMSDLVREVQRSNREDAKKYQLDQFEANQQRYQRLYQLNQIFPPNNFLNPMRWSDFINEIQKKDTY